MQEEPLAVVFTADDKSFRCPKCGKVLNEYIRNNGVVQITNGESVISRKAILCPAYCPNCFQRLSFDSVLDDIAEYMPAVNWEAVKENDIAEKLYNATKYSPWGRPMPTTD